MKHISRFLVLLFVASAFHAAVARQATLRVANYNVENLFDATINQKINKYTGEPGDKDFCPQSWRRWTEERYRTKVERLAWVLAQMKADIVCMEEVENRAVVEALVACAKEKFGWDMPYVAHHDTPDPRGIDMAIVSRHPIRATRYKTVRGRRGILIAEIDVDGTTVHVLANHWKSQIGDAKENIKARTTEAARTRDEFLKILAADPNAVVLCCGDFNEDLDGPAMMTGFRPALDRATAVASLKEAPEEIHPYNLIADIPEKGRGSFYYARYGIWNTFDSILVAPRMLMPATCKDGPAWRVGEPTDTETFKRPEMLFGKENRPNSYKRVRAENRNEYYTNGYSDHFPVVTTLHRAPDPEPAVADPAA